MSVENLIDTLLAKVPTNIRDIVVQYVGLFYLGDKECDIVYNFESKCHKLRDLNTNEIGVLDCGPGGLYTTFCEHLLDYLSYEHKSYEIPNIASNDLPIEFFSRNDIISYIKLLWKFDENFECITWLNPGEKFSIIYDKKLKVKHILTAKTAIRFSPGNELYKYYPLGFHANDTHVVYFDKLKNAILNKDKTHLAILLSMGFDAPKWALKSNANLFNVTKVLQILPEDKLSKKKLRHYEFGSPVKNLHVHWVPVGVDFVIYHTFDKGENIKFVSDFEFTA